MRVGRIGAVQEEQREQDFLSWHERARMAFSHQGPRDQKGQWCCEGEQIGMLATARCAESRRNWLNPDVRALTANGSIPVDARCT